MLDYPHIFLSYARIDESRVKALYDKLSKGSFKPWMDTIDIVGGENWEKAIQQAIRKSDFFIACLSTNSVNRRGILQKEIKMALDVWQERLNTDIYIVPLRLEECEVPEAFRPFQWIDYFREDGLIKLLQSINEGMKRLGRETPIDMIRRDVSAWNKWRQQNPSFAVDLSFVDLSGLNLHGVNLQDISLVGADLREASVLKGNLQRANLSRANLEDTNLGKSNFLEATLADATLQRAKAFFANFEGANLLNANLKRISMWEANLIGANFTKADLSDATLVNVKMLGTRFQETDLRGVTFTIEMVPSDMNGYQMQDLTSVSKALANVKTLYNAKLSPEVKERIDKDWPHLLVKPND